MPSTRRSILALAFCLALAAASPSAAFQLFRLSDFSLSLISPATTASPVEVLVWVRDTVSLDDETWATGRIRAALDRWENVATSHIRFTIVTVRSATQPAVASDQLLVVVANDADVTSGDASPPVGGSPGVWHGAQADWRQICGPPGCEGGFEIVATHEIGHAIGFMHSTMGDLGSGSPFPIMYWAGGNNALTADDVAAVSLAYPEAGAPLSATTGTIRGRAVRNGSGFPLSGINAVALDSLTGAPTIAHLSGTNGVAGAFELPGLPPATYELKLVDGKSFGGINFGLAVADVQTNNFAPLSAGSHTVGAGSVIDLGDVAVAIEPVIADRANLGPTPLIASSGEELPGPAITSLPSAQLDVPYQAWLHLRGGVRPLSLQGASGLPGGFAAQIVSPLSNQRSGEHFIEVAGTPASTGTFAVVLDLADLEGTTSQVAVSLEVPAPELNDAEAKCQDTVARALGKRLAARGKCIAQCDAAAVAGEPRACAGTFDAETADCLLKSQSAAASALRKKCAFPIAACPECYDANLICDPDVGFTRWDHPPVALVDDLADQLEAFVLCDDVSSGDGLSAAEAECRQTIVRQGAAEIAKLLKCQATCHRQVRKGKLPGDTDCSATTVEPKTAGCIAKAVEKATTKFACDAPECFVAAPAWAQFLVGSANGLASTFFCDG